MQVHGSARSHPCARFCAPASVTTCQMSRSWFLIYYAQLSSLSYILRAEVPKLNREYSKLTSHHITSHHITSTSHLYLITSLAHHVHIIVLFPEWFMGWCKICSSDRCRFAAESAEVWAPMLHICTCYDQSDGQILRSQISSLEWFSRWVEILPLSQKVYTLSVYMHLDSQSKALLYSLFGIFYRMNTVSHSNFSTYARVCYVSTLNRCP